LEGRETFKKIIIISNLFPFFVDVLQQVPSNLEVIPPPLQGAGERSHDSFTGPTFVDYTVNFRVCD
jgi:hypothetical protein